MASFSAEQLAQAAFDLKLIDDRQLRDVWSFLGSRNVNAAKKKASSLAATKFCTW